MALYQQITITEAGAQLISGIILNGGTPLTFEAVAVGSGELEAGTSTAAFTGLISEAKRLPIETVTHEGGIITVTARLATDTLTADLYHREVGVYANGILLAYGNTGDQYDYIPTAGNNAAVQKIIRVPLAIGTMQHTFAEMDTTDLVTHAALEARVASIVEPAIREIVTPEIAKESFNEAVRDIAREAAEEGAADAYAAQVKAEAAAAEALVSETNINLTIGNALYEPGEFKTANGMQNFVARCFEIKKPVSGIIEKISIPFRTSTDVYDTTYRGTPVYLSVFEQNASGEWAHLGMSTNAITQDIGATGNYAFDKLPLSGLPIRLIVVTSRANTQFDTSLYMGVRVETSTDGAAYTESSLTPVSNYLISATFSGMYIKYTPAAHARDTTIHTTASEKATYKAKADWLDSKDRYQAAFWRDSNGTDMSTNYLMCLKGKTKRVSLYCKATPQTWSRYILLKAEIIFPKGTENDITVTPDETNIKDQLTFDITTSAEATEKNYLIHFEVIYLGAGTTPMYMSSLLHIEAAL